MQIVKRKRETYTRRGFFQKMEERMIRKEGVSAFEKRVQKEMREKRREK